MSWNPFSRFSKGAGAAAPDPAASPSAAPCTYAQWSECLDALSKGDDDEACLQRLSAGTLSWTGGVAPLFVERINAEVQRRLNLCSQRLTRDLQRSREESLLVRAIVQARLQLNFVHRLCQLPALPETTRKQLAAEIDKFAHRAQSSLQDSAKADRSGRLELLFKNNPLTRYLQAEPVSAQPHTLAAGQTTSQAALSADGVAGTAGAGLRKRNILL